MEELKSYCALIFLTSLVMTVESRKYAELEIDKKDWVDPSDMLNFDMSTKTMRNKPKNPDKQIITDPLEKDLEPKLSADLQKISANDIRKKNDMKLKAEEQKIKNVEETAEHQVEVLPSHDAPHFKRFVNCLLRHLEGIVDSQTRNFNVRITLNENSVKIMSEFTKTGSVGSLQHTSDILSEMVEDVRPVIEDETLWSFDEIFGMTFTTAIQVLVVFSAPICLMYFEHHLINIFSLRQQFLWLLSSVFIISLPWNWVHLYKQEFARKQAILLKTIPPECQPQDMTWTRMLSAFFSGWATVKVDKCQKYHEALSVDPFWEVSPVRVISVTIAKLVLEPAEYLGIAFNKLVTNSLADLSPFIMWFTLISAVFIIIVIALMFFGYSIRIPFFLHIERGCNNLPSSAASISHVMQQTALPPAAIPAKPNSEAFLDSQIKEATRNSIEKRESPTPDMQQIAEVAPGNQQICPEKMKAGPGPSKIGSVLDEMATPAPQTSQTFQHVQTTPVVSTIDKVRCKHCKAMMQIDILSMENILKNFHVSHDEMEREAVFASGDNVQVPRKQAELLKLKEDGHDESGGCVGGDATPPSLISKLRHATDEIRNAILEDALEQTRENGKAFLENDESLVENVIRKRPPIYEGTQPDVECHECSNED